MDAFDALVVAAGRARDLAVAPYSNFKVGAALLAADGSVHAGGNIESASYGLTMCAERVAIFKALSEGVRRFSAIAVVADTAHPTPPCGACRQLIWEYCGDIPVILGNLNGPSVRHAMHDLLPMPFDATTLEG